MNARPSPTDVIKALFADSKGVLAMDESIPTCNRRFAALGIAQNEDTRRAWRELLVTAPGLGDSIGGAILCDETFRQKTSSGRSMVEALVEAGIIPGIKVDAGTSDLAGCLHEHVTEGLDGLRRRLDDYALLGARFTKWRALITLGDGIPSRACIEANAHALARFAASSQAAGLVPIVEPEVSIDGAHSIERCSEVSEEVLRAVFEQLVTQRVTLETMVLKPAMITPGLQSTTQVGAEVVAEATLRCFFRAVPAAVPAIGFLSGGQSPALASERLNAITVRVAERAPWALAFSFGRALQQPALALWRGEARMATAAQQALVHRAKCNRAARQGAWSPALES